MKAVRRTLLLHNLWQLQQEVSIEQMAIAAAVVAFVVGMIEHERSKSILDGFFKSFLNKNNCIW